MNGRSSLLAAGVLLVGIGGCRDEVGSPTEPALHAMPAGATVALSVRQLELGFGYSCGVTTSGRGYCWGQDDAGQLGDGSLNRRRLKPVAVTGGIGFLQVSAGEKHTCGVTSDHRAYCWGWNKDGRLGDGTLSNRTAPVLVAGGLQFSEIRAGQDHTCGRTTLNRIYCWGNNEWGQLGIGVTGGTRRTPRAVTGGLQFKQVTAGWSFTCGVTTGGLAHCWGSNAYGRLGDNTDQIRVRPTPSSAGCSSDGWMPALSARAV